MRKVDVDVDHVLKRFVDGFSGIFRNDYWMFLDDTYGRKSMESV